MEDLEIRSQCSNTSRSSRSSSASVIAARARAKAEAARTQASFAQKEADMLKAQAYIEEEQKKAAAVADRKKAELEANLHTLRLESAAAAANAEAEVLEAAAENEVGDPDRISLKSECVEQGFATNPKSDHSHHDSQPQEPVPTPTRQLTMEVGEPVKRCMEKGYTQSDEISVHEFQELPTQYTFTPEQAPSSRHHQGPYKSALYDFERPNHSSPLRGSSSHRNHSHMATLLGNHDQPSQPYSTFASREPESGSAAMSDLAKYLVRREMVSSGLLKYDDQPENYRAWKASFYSSIESLHLAPREELDLLCKWLGPKSSEQARRIRAVHIHDAAAGVNMVWQRLEDCFGSPEAIENALFRKIEDFPKISNRDNQKLREFGDILLELEAARADGFLTGLSYLDTSRGITPIVQKLPYSLHDKWVSLASRYKEAYRASYPPFSIFAKFVCDQAKILNDPSFTALTGPSMNKTERPFKQNLTPVSVRRTDVSVDTDNHQDNSGEKAPIDLDKQCPLHLKPHPLRKCRGFRSKSLDERKTYLRDKNICYRCCASSSHLAKNCDKNIQCRECNSDSHPTALHPGPAPWTSGAPVMAKDQGGEQREGASLAITSKCTDICGTASRSRSCAKICLVSVYPEGHRERAVRTYAVVDEQSNRSLARSEFFELFDIKEGLASYTLKTCSGVIDTIGRRANNFIMESLDGKNQIPLPSLIECDMLPDDRSEIPTPEIAKHYSHLKGVVGKIPPLDPTAAILILLGRDIPRVHKVRKQCNGPHNAPYAQRLDLGWVIIGEVCLGSAHKPDAISVYKTNILSNGRPSLFDPCPSKLHIKEKVDVQVLQPGVAHLADVDNLFSETDCLGKGVFQQTAQDDKPAMSVEDKIFLEIMDKEMFMDDSNSWVAPLPFREPRRKLPNNRVQAENRLKTLRRRMERSQEMREHMLAFMQRIFESGHAEPAPLLPRDQERWYLPIFGVYHPRKPGQIRAVFDSSAKHDGISLNDILLSGPDLNNSLLGVLTRFRKEPIAVVADIEQMFYCFRVCEEHRDFLRFLWFQNNDPAREVAEYRMTVHVFGNSPSPAVAIYGLRRAALQEEDEYGLEAKQFVLRDFYMDDGLASFPTSDLAIHVLKQTKEMLAVSNIRLHKIASNHKAVMEAFPPEERAKELKGLALGVDPLPVQRSLGLNWNLQSDSFTFFVSREEKPFTRRGVLSTVNSLFDPLGFVAPITIQGKSLVRELSSEYCEWDAPLPAEKKTRWKTWKDSLIALEQLQIPRSYLPVSLVSTQARELCVFSDASTTAISAVAYIRTVDNQGNIQVGFCMGKSKLAPKQCHTVPRLELCAAVLAVELADTLVEELDMKVHTVKFYTDSRVVLGYICNTNRRFYVYVANRVARIRKSTRSEQWHFINTGQNPADHGTRDIPATLLKETNWFCGPLFLKKKDNAASSQQEVFELVEPDLDADVRPLITTLATNVSKAHLGSHRFERFSSWKQLTLGVARLIQKVRSCIKTLDESKMDNLSQARTVIIRCVQHEIFKEEIKNLSKGESVSKDSHLRKLDPIMDTDGLLRIGGRLSSAAISWEEKHPIIIPKLHHIATLLVRYYHERVAHQGRHITEGAIRSAGLWILGGKRLVSSVLHKCVTCLKLRGETEMQKMSNLPVDRVTQVPPFTHVGMDVFGPWTVCARRTRGGLSEGKRWAVLFTCLVTRAVHIEVVESLSTSSFINALRRFTAIRGPAKLFRSDRGTNFVGACRELGITPQEAELQSYLKEQGCTWDFNVPHSSHMGGAWERMIGVARRILDAMLLKVHSPKLSHEVLVTLLAEVVAIMNARPIVPVSSDPHSPAVLTPAMLLTQKTDSLTAPLGYFDLKDLYRSQWKQVQNLADHFWKQWRQEYLATLQPRRKWQTSQPNLQFGDVVLLKDKGAKRNEWPMGLIVNTFPGRDGRVRQVEVRVVQGGSARVYSRPISEVVLLFRET